MEAVQFRKFGCKTEAKIITSSLSKIINDEVAINIFLFILVRIDSNIATTALKSISTVATFVLYYDNNSIKFCDKTDNPFIKFRNIWYK